MRCKIICSNCNHLSDKTYSEEELHTLKFKCSICGKIDFPVRFGDPSEAFLQFEKQVFKRPYFQPDSVIKAVGTAMRSAYGLNYLIYNKKTPSAEHGYGVLWLYLKFHWSLFLRDTQMDMLFNGNDMPYKATRFAFILLRENSHDKIGIFWWSPAFIRVLYKSKPHSFSIKNYERKWIDPVSKRVIRWIEKQYVVSLSTALPVIEKYGADNRYTDIIKGILGMRGVQYRTIPNKVVHEWFASKIQETFRKLDAEAVTYPPLKSRPETMIPTHYKRILDILRGADRCLSMMEIMNLYYGRELSKRERYEGRSLFEGYLSGLIKRGLVVEKKELKYKFFCSDDKKMKEIAYPSLREVCEVVTLSDQCVRVLDIVNQTGLAEGSVRSFLTWLVEQKYIKRAVRDRTYLYCRPEIRTPIPILKLDAHKLLEILLLEDKCLSLGEFVNLTGLTAEECSDRLKILRDFKLIDVVIDPQGVAKFCATEQTKRTYPPFGSR